MHAKPPRAFALLAKLLKLRSGGPSVSVIDTEDLLLLSGLFRL